MLIWALVGLGLLYGGAVAYYYWNDPTSTARRQQPPSARGNRGMAAIITAPIAWLLVGNGLGPLGIILAFVGVMLGVMARERDDRILGLWGIGIGLLAPAIVLGSVLIAWAG